MSYSLGVSFPNILLNDALSSAALRTSSSAPNSLNFAFIEFLLSSKDWGRSSATSTFDLANPAIGLGASLMFSFLLH